MVCSGRLCGASAFGEVGIQREQRAAIVQDEARAFRHDSRAEIRIVALDQRHHVAVAIHDAQIDGVCCRAAACPATTLQFALSGSISLARVAANSLESSCAHRQLRKFRIADVAHQIGIGQLLRFDHGVQRGARSSARSYRAETSP